MHRSNDRRSRAQLMGRVFRPHPQLMGDVIRNLPCTVLRLALLLPAVVQSTAFAQERADRPPITGLACEGKNGRLPPEWVRGGAAVLTIVADKDTVSISPPARLYSPPLRYPPQAQAQAFEAAVVVQGIVEVDGRVRFGDVVDARVRQDPRHRAFLTDRWRQSQDGPPPMSHGEARAQFEREALGLLYQSQFEAATKDGEPVRVLICLPVNFELRRR